MMQLLLTTVPIVVEKFCDLAVEYFTQQAYQAGYAAGFKVGLLYGAGGVLLLVLVVGTVIFIIKQVQQSHKPAYGI